MQKKYKCETRSFVKDFVDDLVRLEDKKRSGLSFTTELKAMICDGPQRAECKGIKSQTGYYCCDRCKTKGIKIGQGNVHFPEFNAKKRKESEWWHYYKKESDPVDKKSGEILVRFKTNIHIYYFPMCF